ncbi:hypothetical protein Ciccas_005719 [Cichlidogyrus casuarinus]|uniref:Inner centromere protein ARK-binding domain-containing protein n=1 Tax=Cichlidogyrus casuarinus TaxID=1844966 RepID=A0ABD2Q7V1_9PLAT
MPNDVVDRIEKMFNDTYRQATAALDDISREYDAKYKIIIDAWNNGFNEEDFAEFDEEIISDKHSHKSNKENASPIATEGNMSLVQTKNCERMNETKFHTPDTSMKGKQSLSSRNEVAQMQPSTNATIQPIQFENSRLVIEDSCLSDFNNPTIEKSSSRRKKVKISKSLLRTHSRPLTTLGRVTRGSASNAASRSPYSEGSKKSSEVIKLSDNKMLCSEKFPAVTLDLQHLAPEGFTIGMEDMSLAQMKNLEIMSETKFHTPLTSSKDKQSFRTCNENAQMPPKTNLNIQPSQFDNSRLVIDDLSRLSDFNNPILKDSSSCGRKVGISKPLLRSLSKPVSSSKSSSNAASGSRQSESVEVSSEDMILCSENNPSVSQQVPNNKTITYTTFETESSSGVVSSTELSCDKPQSPLVCDLDLPAVEQVMPIRALSKGQRASVKKTLDVKLEVKMKEEQKILELKQKIAQKEASTNKILEEQRLKREEAIRARKEKLMQAKQRKQQMFMEQAKSKPPSQLHKPEGVPEPLKPKKLSGLKLQIHPNPPSTSMLPRQTFPAEPRKPELQSLDLSFLDSDLSDNEWDRERYPAPAWSRDTKYLTKSVRDQANAEWWNELRPATLIPFDLEKVFKGHHFKKRARTSSAWYPNNYFNDDEVD